MLLALLATLACTDEPGTDDSGGSGSGSGSCELPPNLTSSPDEDCWGYPDAVDCDCDGFAVGEDCDDRNSYTFPGADDIPYNGVDDDCAGDGDLVDWDGDGYESVQVGGLDCNDANKDIFPGAEEVCYNGIDEDCDGLPDTDDCDGDGYPGIGDNKTDCDDRDPDRNPSVDEIWYDGVDQDCSGTSSDYDADGDGDDSDTYPDKDGVLGTDCDDSDPLTAGGNPELLDGQDRDCDGVVDLLNSRDGAAWWAGSLGVNDGFLGYSAEILEDYDGDGFASVAIGGFGITDDFAGRVYILDVGDGDGKPHEVSTASIDGVSYDYLGSAMDYIGDLDADGFGELLVAAPVTNGGAGEVYLFLGSTLAAGGAMGAAESITTMTGGQIYTGFDVASLGDIDGDGLPELALSTAWAGADYGGAPHAVVYSGADALLGGALTPVSAMLQIDGAATNGGHTLGGVDLDQDGVNEFLFPTYTTGQGVLCVVWGADIADGGATSTDDYDWIRGSSGEKIGITSGWYDDLDGNGYPELLVRAYGHDGDAAGGQGGRIYVVDSSEITAGQGHDAYVDSQAMGTIEGTVDNGHVKTPETQGDLDGDGVDDLIVMHAGDRDIVNPVFLEGEAVRAKGYVLWASDLSAGGSVPADYNAADHIFDGWKDDELTGYSMLVGDMDYDGLDDVLFGSPGASGSAASRAGNAHVLLSYLDGDYSGL